MAHDFGLLADAAGARVLAVITDVADDVHVNVERRLAAALARD